MSPEGRKYLSILLSGSLKRKRDYTRYFMSIYRAVRRLEEKMPLPSRPPLAPKDQWGSDP